MVLQVRTVAGLFDAPKTDAKILKTIFANQGINLREISRTTDGDWVEVEAAFARPLHCFVKSADVVEVTEFKFAPVDLWSFVYFSTVASETFNQRQATASVGVSRDYILALALVLNGLEEKGLTEDVLQAFDPFHFTEAEWKEFCESSGNTSNYQDFDRFDPLAQIDAAIFFTFRSTSEIDRTLTNPVDPGGPHIPSSMDLFLVHMLGHTAGVAALHDRAIASSGGSKPWASFVGAGGLEALKKRYPKFLDVAEAASVDQLLDLIEKAFDKAYVNVAKIISDAFPEDVPQAGGPPPWLKIAEDEEAKDIKEPDRHIVDYFKATDFGPTATPTTSWCGAFAAFCMKNSGIPVPKGAARAANWGKWGKQLCSPGTPADKIPAGAVVVFSPSPGTTGSPGHVAFFVSGDSKHVNVLGGNQHDSLKESNFPRTQILHIRWPNDSAVPSGASADIPSGAPTFLGGSIFEAKAPVIMDRLMKDFQLTEFQAAGVLGNIGTECNGFKNFQEIKPIGGGKGGFGWCQWTGMRPGDRRFNFEKFCRDNHLSMTSDEGNYGFLQHELQTSENRALQFLKATTTLKDAVRIFEDKFERAGVKYFGSRDKFARIALDAHRQGKV